MANARNYWYVTNTGYTAVSTAMNSLANTSVATSSTAITNSTDLVQYGQYELALAQAAFVNSGYVSIWHVNNISTGYETMTTASLARPADVVIPLAGLNGPQTASSQIVLLPPNDFKVAIQNNAGVSFAASGSTLKLKTFVDRAVGE